MTLESPNNLNQPEEERNPHTVLGMISIGYAIVAGLLLGSLFIVTISRETVPIAWVIGTGTYGIAAVGALLQLVVGIGLCGNVRWLAPLIQATSTAIIVPLILAVLLFLMLPMQADLNHQFWSIMAVIIGVPWPAYLASTMKRSR